MRSKTAAVVLVLISSALVFGLNTATASAATIGARSEAAGALPFGLTGSVGSLAVLLGLVGLVFGLTRRGRRSLAAKRAVGSLQPDVQTRAGQSSIGEPTVVSGANSAA
jgi:hypothetical protein